MNSSPPRRLGGLLKLSIQNGILDAVRAQINSDSQMVNARDKAGVTPLMLAARHGHAELCRLLISSGAQSEDSDNQGRTALNHAMIGKHDNVVTALLQTDTHSPEKKYSDTENETQPRSVLDDLTDHPQACNRQNADIFLETGHQEQKNDTVLAEMSDVEQISVSDSEDSFPLPHDDGQKNEDIYIPDDSSILGDWEADEIPERPDSDESCQQQSEALQEKISTHFFRDDTPDLSDIDIFLPEGNLYSPDLIEEYPTVFGTIMQALQVGQIDSKDLDQACQTDIPEHADRAFYTVKEQLTARDIAVISPLSDIDPYSTSNPSYLFYENTIFSVDHQETTEEILQALHDVISDDLNNLELFRQDANRYDVLDKHDEIRIAQEIDGALVSALKTLADTGMPPTGTLTSFSSETEEEEETPSPPSQQSQESFLQLLDRVMAGYMPDSRSVSIPRPDEHEISQLYSLCTQLQCSKDGERLRHHLQRYEKARNHLANSNLRLAMHIAQRYRRSVIHLNLDDLIQEATLGLLKSCVKFDYRMGFKFSTYSTWWIRQQVTRSISDRERCIRLPVHVDDKIKKLSRYQEEFLNTNGRNAGLKDMSAFMESPPDRIEQLLSLTDAELQDEYDIADTCFHEVATETDRLIASMTREHQVKTLINTLDERERKVMVMRFGLGLSDEYTLEDTGQAFGVTRERVRQIESKALGKLRKRASLNWPDELSEVNDEAKADAKSNRKEAS